MYTQKLYGYRFGEYIKAVGWDRDDCWFAHCCKVMAGAVAENKPDM